jgi:hypothetical protein
VNCCLAHRRNDGIVMRPVDKSTRSGEKNASGTSVFDDRLPPASAAEPLVPSDVLLPENRGAAPGMTAPTARWKANAGSRDTLLQEAGSVRVVRDGISALH